MLHRVLVVLCDYGVHVFSVKRKRAKTENVIEIVKRLQTKEHDMTSFLLEKKGHDFMHYYNSVVLDTNCRL